MIEYFKSHDIMNKELIFEIINERGTLEQGLGIGVTREVYTLFWNEFANSIHTYIHTNIHTIFIYTGLSTPL